jgi:mannose/cellobiose epimerase-like protein (N-acyl-D-glucosamine 2-epimerase family)
MVGASTVETTGFESADIVDVLGTLHSLPLWSVEGWDQSASGFVEKLDSEGRADQDAPRRGRVQARLLKGFERTTSCPTGKQRAALPASALRYQDTGCLWYEGRVDESIRKCMRRRRAQTETAKAWIAQAEAGEQSAADEARKARCQLYRHSLRHPVPGCRYDQFDRNNRSLVDSIVAATVYHILSAVTEADRVLG